MSLFSRIGKFSPGALRDPAEERLTEALAATLRIEQEVTRHILPTLGLPEPPASPLRVTTQRRTDQGDRVDVELRFGTASRTDLLVWLELKDRARADGWQMSRYRKALDEVAAERDALVLVTRSDDPTPGRDAGWPGASTRHVSWQDVSRALELAATETDSSPLTFEFLDYLKEEDLAQMGTFDELDAHAIDRFQPAWERLTSIVEAASERLSKRYVTPGVDGATDGYSKPDITRTGGFWRTYLLDERVSTHGERPSAANVGAWATNPHSADGRCWLEWHGRDDYARQHETGRKVFGAGVGMKTDEAFDPRAYATWLRELAQAGFEYGPGSTRGDYRYLFRYLYPAELVAGFDFDEQTQILVRWVESAFAYLTEHPPFRDAEDAAPDDNV